MKMMAKKLRKAPRKEPSGVMGFSRGATAGGTRGSWGRKLISESNIHIFVFIIGNIDKITGELDTGHLLIIVDKSQMQLRCMLWCDVMWLLVGEMLDGSREL